MAKLHAKNGSLYLYDSSNACQSLSGRINTITLSQTGEQPEVTAFGDVSVQRLWDGITDWELSFDAFFDNAANQVDSVLSGIVSGSTFMKFGPAGSAATCTMYSSCAILTNYEINLDVADAAKVSGTLVNRSGSITRTSSGTWT